MTITEVNDGCHWHLNGSVNRNCEDWSHRKVKVDGILEYKVDDWDAKIATIESDSSETLPLNIRNLSKADKRELLKVDGKNVTVYGILNTECVTASISVDQETDATGQIISIGGYCHTQSQSYLSDYNISETEQ